MQSQAQITASVKIFPWKCQKFNQMCLIKQILFLELSLFTFSRSPRLRPPQSLLITIIAKSAQNKNINNFHGACWDINNIGIYLWANSANCYHRSDLILFARSPTWSPRFIPSVSTLLVASGNNKYTGLTNRGAVAALLGSLWEWFIQICNTRCYFPPFREYLFTLCRVASETLLPVDILFTGLVSTKLPKVAGKCECYLGTVAWSDNV